MDEKNNFQEKSTKPKTPKSKLPLIIGGIAAGVAVIALSVALILGGGNANDGGNIVACKHDDPTQIVVVSAVAPTCQKTGLTEGKYCSVCDEVLISQKVVEALGHKGGKGASSGGAGGGGGGVVTGEVDLTKDAAVVIIVGDGGAGGELGVDANGSASGSYYGGSEVGGGAAFVVEGAKFALDT